MFQCWGTEVCRCLSLDSCQGRLYAFQ